MTSQTKNLYLKRGKSVEINKFEAGMEVEAEVQVFSLNGIDVVNHTYRASVYAALRRPKGETTVDEMKKIKPTFLNLKSCDRYTTSVDTTDTHVCQHIFVVGEWCSQLSLEDFPMDKQHLKIEFELWHDDDMGKPLMPVAVGNSFAKGFMLSDSYQIHNRVKEHVCQVGIPTFVVAMTLSRKTGFYVWTYIMPITLMSSLSFCVLGMDDDDVSGRVGTVLTLLLTVVAYKMALSGNLPAMSSMCWLDKYMAGVFLILMIVAVLCSLGNGRPWLDGLIAACAIPWAIFNLYGAVTICRWRNGESGLPTHEGYEQCPSEERV